jgi:hypothetical protein
MRLVKLCIFSKYFSDYVIFLKTYYAKLKKKKNSYGGMTLLPECPIHVSQPTNSILWISMVVYLMFLLCPTTLDPKMAPVNNGTGHCTHVHMAKFSSEKSKDQIIMIFSKKKIFCLPSPFSFCSY